jgi:hypothetical protein
MPDVEEGLHSRPRGDARPEPVPYERASWDHPLQIASEDLGVFDSPGKDRYHVARFPHQTVGALPDGLDLTALDLRERGMVGLFDLAVPARGEHDALPRIESQTDVPAAEHDF